jgi:cytoskeletal protein CcmA (bactofilin family)
MFTKKPEREAGDALQRITERSGGESPSPLAERTPSYARGSAPTKMVPSIIGEDLIITGNVDSKGEIQVDGEIRGDIHCGSLLLGDKSTITGSVTAEDVVVRGKVVGSVRGLRVTLQAQSHVEGDIYHQSLAIEQGAYFEGKSRRSDDPMKEGLASKPSTVADKTPRFEGKPSIEVRVDRPGEIPTSSPTRAAE